VPIARDRTQHELAFALRVDDHFSRLPVGEELDVRVHTGEASVATRAGTLRHDDGTYRWANLGDGLRHVTVAARSGRWVRWDPAPVDLVVPIADRSKAIAVEMWPTPLAAPPAGIGAIRGKLLGAAVGKLRVEINPSPPATAIGRFTLSDEQGEFLYLLPGGPWALTARGAMDLTITIPGRAVASVDVHARPTPFIGPRFEIPTRLESRVRFHVI
jgi:hypothetical protein